jgi:hypothetical protein
MFNQFLDKDQREVFDILESKAYCLVNSKSKEQLSKLVWTAILHQFYNKQGVVISIKDTELKSIILAKLQAHRLESYVFDTEKEALSSTLTSKWAVLAKKEDLSIKSSKKEEAFSHLIRKAEAYLNARNKAIFGRKSWKHIQEIKDNRMGDDSETLPLPYAESGFEFNQSEYWNLKSKIEEAARLWNPLYHQIRAQSLFQKEAELNHGHLHTLLLKWKSDLLEVKTSIHRYLSQLREETTKSYLKYYEEGEQIIIQLPSKLALLKEEQKKGSKPVFFGKKKSKNLNSLEEFHKEIKQNPLFQELDLNTSLDDLQSSMTDVLANWKPSLNKEIRTQIKRLTRLNIEDNTYTKSVSKLTHLFDAINKEGIINFHFEFTAHSLEAQLQYCDEVQDILDRILWIFEHQASYLDWHQFYARLSKSEEKLINTLLKKEDNHWLELFEQWYICALVEAHYSPHFVLDRDEALGQRILQKSEEYIEEFLDNWMIDMNTLIHKGLVSIKHSNKKLFQVLIGKTVQEAPISPDQISLFCPILLGAHPSKNLLITDHPVAKLQGQKCIELNLEDWIEEAIYLENSIHIDQSIGELPLSQRLSKIKALASNLRYYSSQNRIFILKDKTIITCLSDLSNRRFLDLRKEQIVKEIHLGSDPIQRITEYLLLNELPCEIWIDNFVIQEEMPSSMLAQIKLIQAFKDAGYWVKTKVQLEDEIRTLPNENIQAVDNHSTKQDNIEIA